MRHVLVVEHDPDVAEVVCAALEMGGYRVSAAATADGAWTALTSVRPDVAVISAVLPLGSGLTVACRAIDLGVPVAIMTGSPETQRELEAANCPYLAKPFRVGTLMAVVGSLMNDAPDDLNRMRELLRQAVENRRVAQRNSLLEQAQRNRIRAEEYRAVSEQMQNPTARASYQHLAASYDAMAAQLEEIVNRGGRKDSEVG